LRNKRLKVKDRWEFSNTGDYQVIYPLKNEYLKSSAEEQLLHDLYDEMIGHSKALFQNQTSGKNNLKLMKMPEGAGGFESQLRQTN